MFLLLSSTNYGSSMDYMSQ